MLGPKCRRAVGGPSIQENTCKLRPPRTLIRACERPAPCFISLALKVHEALRPSARKSRRFKACEGVDGCIFRKIVPARKSRLSLSSTLSLVPPSPGRVSYMTAAAASIYGRVITRTATGVQGRIGFRGRAEGDHSRALHAEGNDRLNDDGSSTEMQAKSSTDNLSVHGKCATIADLFYALSSLSLSHPNWRFSRYCSHVASRATFELRASEAERASHKRIKIYNRENRT